MNCLTFIGFLSKIILTGQNMAKEYVLVLDIGSSKMRALLAGQGVNNTFIVKAQAQTEYDGFYEGRFLNPNALSEVVQGLLNELDLKNYEKIYVGVPAEFSSVVLTTATLNLGERRKIKKSDIDELFYTAGERAKVENVEVVSVNPISFKLDEGRISNNPIGEQAMTITADLSVIYSTKEFIDMFNRVVAGLGFEGVEYISESLSEALTVVSEEGREDLNMVINVGDLTTSVAFVKGEGLVYLASFSQGGGHFTNDLSEAFELTLSEADRLKRQIVLSLKGGENDFYELTLDQGKVVKIPLNFANEVVASRIDIIASAISQCMQMFSSTFIPYLPVFLTGAGVSQIKGGRDYLAKCLGRNIFYGVPPLPGKDKPQNASLYSLVNMALNKK